MSWVGLAWTQSLCGWLLFGKQVLVRQEDSARKTLGGLRPSPCAILAVWAVVDSVLVYFTSPRVL